MSLLKEVEYKGITCNYHKIVQIDTEFSNHSPNADTYTKMDVTVALFKDATQRDDDVGRALRIKQYHFLKSVHPSPANEKIDQVYKALKKLDEFNGATDV
jgi:thymidylate synthase